MENEVVKTHSSGVSVYIPCFNSEAYIERCLAGVFAQTYPIQKVIVVNDGSTDNTLAILRNYASKIELISYQPNKGLAYARNSALMRIATTYVASLDADCYAEKDWLERLMVLFSSYDVAGASGRLIGFHVERLAEQWREVHIKQHWGEKRIINPPYLCGNNTVFNINVLKEVGLYDERFMRNGEDMDISKKIYRKGYKLIYEPQAKVKHLRTDTIHSVINARWRYTCLRIEQEINIYTLCRVLVRNILRSFYYVALDLIHVRLHFLILDIGLLFYSVVMDTKVFFEER